MGWEQGQAVGSGRIPLGAHTAAFWQVPYRRLKRTSQHLQKQIFKNWIWDNCFILLFKERLLESERTYKSSHRFWLLNFPFSKLEKTCCCYIFTVKRTGLKELRRGEKVTRTVQHLIKDVPSHRHFVVECNTLTEEEACPCLQWCTGSTAVDVTKQTLASTGN